MSESFNKQVTAAAKELEVYTARSWTTVVAVLEGVAGGTNELAMGGELVPFEAGNQVSVTLSPGSKVRIRTSSTTPVQWSFFITELTWIDQVMGIVCRLGVQ
jgi:hypothetical protein